MKLKHLHIIAVVFLVLALAKLPIGYYTLLRIAITGIAGYSAFIMSDKNRNWMFLFGGIAILFNPIIPIYFGKDIWVVIDLLVAVIFVLSIIKFKEINI